MAIAELPPTFREIQLTEAERSAVMQFLAEVPTTAPSVNVLAPRRSSSGHLKVVMAFPEGVDTYEMTAALVALVQRIEQAHGVYLHLD